MYNRRPWKISFRGINEFLERTVGIFKGSKEIMASSHSFGDGNPRGIGDCGK